MPHHLVQLLLPVRDDAGHPYAHVLYEGVASRLTQQFGGMTAYARAPARGERLSDGEPVSDNVIVVEVMVETLDETWWRAFRRHLEVLFRQDVIVVRAHEVRLI